MNLLARLLGYRADESIHDLEVSSAAPWAESLPGALWLGCLLLAMLGGWFYLKQQPLKNYRLGYVFAFMRGLLLCLVLLYLAEPTLNLRGTTHPKPALWLLVDGSSSMAIEDVPPEAARAESPGNPQTAAAKKTRLAQVQDLLRKPDDENMLARLSTKFQLRAFEAIAAAMPPLGVVGGWRILAREVRVHRKHSRGGTAHRRRPATPAVQGIRSARAPWRRPYADRRRRS